MPSTRESSSDFALSRPNRKSRRTSFFTSTFLGSTFRSYSASRYVLALSSLCVTSCTDRPLAQKYPLPVLSSHTLSSALAPPAPSNASALGSSSIASMSAETSLFTIVDPEVVRKNPVEAKHRRLVRDHRNGPLDRELKPNAKIRDELNVRLFPSLSASSGS